MAPNFTRKRIWALLGVLSLPSTGIARTVSIEEAVSLALSNHPEVAVGNSLAHSASHRRKAAGLRRWPSLRVSGSARLWDREFSLQSSGTVIARERLTSRLEATLEQKLLGLRRLNEQQQQLRSLESAAQQESRGRRRGVELAVQIEYLLTLQAGASLEIAGATRAQLEARFAEVTAQYQAGEVNQLEVFRVRTLLTEAGLLEQRTARELSLAHAILVLAIGFDPESTSVELAVPTSLLHASYAAPLPNSIEQTPPQIAAAKHMASAASHQSNVTSSALLPELAMELSLARTDGQPLFAPTHAGYIGLKLDWEAWSWGASREQVNADRALETAAQAQLRLARLEAREELLSAQLLVANARAVLFQRSTEELTVSESQRIVTARMQVGEATLAEAVTEDMRLTRATLERIKTTYECGIAWLRLLHAVGR